MAGTPGIGPKDRGQVPEAKTPSVGALSDHKVTPDPTAPDLSHHVPSQNLYTGKGPSFTAEPKGKGKWPAPIQWVIDAVSSLFGKFFASKKGMSPEELYEKGIRDDFATASSEPFDLEESGALKELLTTAQTKLAAGNPHSLLAFLERIDQRDQAITPLATKGNTQERAQSKKEILRGLKENAIEHWNNYYEAVQIKLETSLPNKTLADIGRIVGMNTLPKTYGEKVSALSQHIENELTILREEQAKINKGLNRLEESDQKIQEQMGNLPLEKKSLEQAEKDWQKGVDDLAPKKAKNDAELSKLQEEYTNLLNNRAALEFDPKQMSKNKNQIAQIQKSIDERKEMMRTAAQTKQNNATTEAGLNKKKEAIDKKKKEVEQTEKTNIAKLAANAAERDQLLAERSKISDASDRLINSQKEIREAANGVINANTPIFKEWLQAFILAQFLAATEETSMEWGTYINSNLAQLKEDFSKELQKNGISLPAGIDLEREILSLIAAQG